MSFVALVFSQNSVLVPDYGNCAMIYTCGTYFETNRKYYNYTANEGGIGGKIRNRSHNWLRYWKTDSGTGNWVAYPDYNGAASYTIPKDGYINFTYMMTSFYTTNENPWTGYDASKTASFAVWLVRGGQLTKLYEKSGLAGTFVDDGLVPVAQGDIIYYGVLNKGNQLPAWAEIKFYPAKLKKIS